MKLSEICIERPVLAWVMTLVLILVGCVLGSRLQLQQYPKFEQPTVNIETIYPGAAPEVVESEITKRYEEAFAGIEGIDFMQSVSSADSSNITIVFRESRDIDEAVNDVRDRISKERDNVPRDAHEPIVSKTKYDATAIMSLSFWCDTMSRRELFDLISQNLKKDFESVPGVGRVDVYGEGMFVMNLYIDPKKMASYGISVEEVKRSILGQNMEKPAGKIVSKNREYLVTTVAGLERPEQFDKMVVMSKNGHLVRFSDIGRAEISSVTAKTRSFFNGELGVSLSVTKQSNVNPISVARGIKKQLEALKEKNQIPSEVKVAVSYDSTTFVERSLYEVERTILEAVLLVILVVFLFLKSFRATLIPIVTIPVSLIGTLTLMYLCGFSLNTFTLLAFVLAVGLVVDDAIVVLENIHRYLEKGQSKIKAAVLGIREVGFAVVAMTLTLAAVYTPVAFAPGFIGKLLTEFSITLACAVILSGFAALTLSPMMCSRILRTKKEEEKSSGKVFRFMERYVPVEHWMASLSSGYEHLLRKYLLKKSTIIVGAVLFAGIGTAVFYTLPSQRFPKEDTGDIWITGRAPQSSTLEYTERYVKDADTAIADIPEIESRSFQITNPTFTGHITLKEHRKRSSDEIASVIAERFGNITGVDFQHIQAGHGSEGSAPEVDFVVRGNKSHKELRGLAHAIGLELKSSNMVDQVLSAINNDTEDYTITILRDKASSLFIDHVNIAETIDVLIRGRKVNTFKKDNKVYDVKVEVENESRSAPEDILNIHIKGGERHDKLIPLAELIRITPRSGPVEIHHYNRTRSVGVEALMDARHGVNDGVKRVEELRREILPPDVSLEFTGSTKKFLEERNVMALVFLLAVLFIYLVMAAQFESWIDPLIILLSVPLAIISAVLTLAMIKNGSINLYSNIGLITLIGLITKHGILIVDFANKIQLQGKNKLEAVIEAALIRLRPVIMTTLAMVLGALPLVLAHGAGAETRWQLGWTIVGGMSFGTLFTLFVVPVFYVLLARVKKPVTVGRGKSKGE